MIYLRRSDENGNVQLLAHSFRVAKHWVHRLVRCEVDFTHQHIRFNALRRRDPNQQPLLHELPYQRPQQTIQRQTMSVQPTLRLCHLDVKKVFNER